MPEHESDNEIVSVALVRPHEGHMQEVVDLLREFYEVLKGKNYSRDWLYRNAGDPGQLVNVRHWTSAEARAQAQEDPDVHRYWRRLAEIAVVERVHERLDRIL
ncbi:MAG TPA: antibiotic biosynthesis monooxygenase [Terriglobales bacterium]|nr:antibiotic biosynthesis monooxygenase [Terriglobales bacterium]